MLIDEHIISSPLGNLCLKANAGSLVALEWTERAITPKPKNTSLSKVGDQLQHYFLNKINDFRVSLAPQGSEFELSVWQAMMQIPHGMTATYGDIAKMTGKPAQAVGHACGRNPIPIIIPCHRVVGSNGHMVGYSGQGGVETKRWLLAHEGALLI